MFTKSSSDLEIWYIGNTRVMHTAKPSDLGWMQGQGHREKL